MKNLLNLLKYLFGFSIIGLLIYKVGLIKIIETFSSISLPFIPLLFFLIFITFLLDGFHLFVLLRSAKERISFFKAFTYSSLVRSISSFIPGKLGDLSLVYLLKKQGLGYGKGLAISFWSKIPTIILFTLIASFGLFIFFDYLISLRILLILYLTIFLFFILIMNKKIRLIIRRFILRKYEILFTNFYNEFIIFIKKRKPLLLFNFFLILFKFFIGTLLIYITFLMFTDSPPAIGFIFLISSILKATTFIPLTISGLGIKEGLAVYLYGFLNIDAALTLSTYLVLMVLSYFVHICFILLFFNQKSLSNKKISFI